MSAPRTLVFATRNKGKVAELQALLAEAGMAVCSLAELEAARVDQRPENPRRRVINRHIRRSAGGGVDVVEVVDDESVEVGVSRLGRRRPVVETDDLELDGGDGRECCEVVACSSAVATDRTVVSVVPDAHRASNASTRSARPLAEMLR